MARRKTICLNDQEYESLVRARAKSELASGKKLDGFGAAIALLAGLYLLDKYQKQKTGQQNQSQRRGIFP